MGKSIHHAESIRINSHCRIVIKNFDSVPQVQRFSNVHDCVARSRHGSIASMSLLTSTKPISISVCCNAGHGFSGFSGSAAASGADSSPESRTPGVVWTVEGVLSDVARCPRLQWRQCSHSQAPYSP